MPRAGSRAISLIIKHQRIKNGDFPFLCWGISLLFLAFIVAFLDYLDKVAAMYEQGVRLSTSWFEALSAPILMMEDAPGSSGRLGIGFMWGTIFAGIFAYCKTGSQTRSINSRLRCARLPHSPRKRLQAAPPPPHRQHFHRHPW